MEVYNQRFFLVRIEIPEGGDLQWIKFNVETNGFYRVNYDNVTWQQLTDNFQVRILDFNLLCCFEITVTFAKDSSGS